MLLMHTSSPTITAEQALAVVHVPAGTVVSTHLGSHPSAHKPSHRFSSHRDHLVGRMGDDHDM